MSTETWSLDQLSTYVEKQYGQDTGEVFRLIRRWTDRGDGVAVYENHDLGHPELGQCQLTSFGSRTAQLETDTVHVTNDSANGHKVEIAQAAMRDWHERGYKVGPAPADAQEHPHDRLCPACSQPPDRLPDIGGAINWRYTLIATYREGTGNGRQHGLVEAADRRGADPRPQPGSPGVGEGE
jgi:hypothetical protein